MTSLAERAAALAGPQAQAPEPPPEYETPAQAAAAEAPRVYFKPEQIPVHEAWNRLMQDVEFIKKTRKVTTGPAKFAFRGIEDVVQAFGASVRRHGLILAPSKVVPSYTTSSSKSGTAMRECTVIVSWSVIGPMGDVLPVPLESAGEAADYSDKSTTKAQSIAERTLLVILGLVPTDDPEPELESAEMERGDARVSPSAYYAEITNPMTSRERLRQVYNELGQHRLVETLVPHEGAQVALGKLLLSVVASRWPAPSPADPPQPAPDPVDEDAEAYQQYASEPSHAEVDRQLAAEGGE